jgi:hypothetical protein
MCAVWLKGLRDHVLIDVNGLKTGPCKLKDRAHQTVFNIIISKILVELLSLNKQLKYTNVYLITSRNTVTFISHFNNRDIFMKSY